MSTILCPVLAKYIYEYKEEPTTILVGSQSSSINDGLVLSISKMEKFPPIACLFGNMLNLE